MRLPFHLFLCIFLFLAYLLKIVTYCLQFFIILEFCQLFTSHDSSCKFTLTKFASLKHFFLTISSLSHYCYYTNRLQIKTFEYLKSNLISYGFICKGYILQSKVFSWQNKLIGYLGWINFEVLNKRKWWRWSDLTTNVKIKEGNYILLNPSNANSEIA